MVEQVNVCIYNLFDSASIEAFREFADGIPEAGSNVTIDAGSEETVPLYEPEIKLIITPGDGVDFGTCWLNVTRNVNLVSWEVMEDHWEMQIADNTLPPEVPTVVNVEVGGGEL